MFETGSFTSKSECKCSETPYYLGFEIPEDEEGNFVPLKIADIYEKLNNALGELMRLK